MPNVLIAGHGYLGRAVATLFQNAGWGVEGWTKSAESAKENLPQTYAIRSVDLTDHAQISSSGGDFNVVIHCASTRGGDVDAYREVYLNGASNLLQRFPHSLLIFVGSTSVYSQRNAEWVTETSAAQPDHERGRILRQTERLILIRDGIVVRLGGIYGPGRSYLLERLLRGEAAVDPQADRFVNQIHRDDAASALFLLATRRPLLRGEIFNVVDDQPILLSECYRWLAGKLPSTSLSHTKSPSDDKRGRSNKRVSNAKLRRVGWVPRYPTFADAMESSILPSFAVKSSV